MEWIGIAYELPNTAGGWATLITAVLGACVIVLGGTIRTAREHIKTRIELETKKMEQQTRDVIAGAVKDSMVSAMAPIKVRLDYIDDKLDSVEETTKGLDRTVRNGLTHRQTRIEDKVDALLKDGEPWDGVDRRAIDSD